MNKKTILLDLDGVLNQYSGNYVEDYIPPIKEGAYEFVQELAQEFEIKVFTTRNPRLVSDWIDKYNLNEYILYATNIKERAYLYIDDRCIGFDGSFKNLKNSIKNFKVYWQ